MKKWTENRFILNLDLDNLINIYRDELSSLLTFIVSRNYASRRAITRFKSFKTFSNFNKKVLDRKKKMHYHSRSSWNIPFKILVKFGKPKSGESFLRYGYGVKLGNYINKLDWLI